MWINPTYHLPHLLSDSSWVILEQLRIVLFGAEYFGIDLFELTVEVGLVGALVEVDEESVHEAHRMDVCAVGDVGMVTAQVGGEFVPAEGA